jgi:HlyD family secretion protein
VDGAAGRVAQAAAALHQAEVNLAYTNIVSPINGTVISRNVDVGQTVAASLSAPTVFVIAEDLKKMQVDTSVAEADVGKLRDGMEATFTVDAYPGRRFKGVVRQIRNAAQTVQNVVTYDAVVDVSNPDLALRPGMTANVTFVHADRQDALRVPNAALRFRPPADLESPRGGAKEARNGPAAAETPGGAGAGRAQGPGPGAGRRAEGAGEPSDRRTVWVLRSLKPEPVRIRTGVSDGSLTEVVEGDLREGDAAVTDVSGGDAKGGAGGPRGGPPRMF